MAQTTNGDAKGYYGYLFESDKKPTKVLDALLRGIAIYIVSCARWEQDCARDRADRMVVAELEYRERPAEEAHARQVSHFLQGCGREL